MTGRSVARVLVRLTGLAVVITSGAYLIIYLYRWEWHRALIAGVFLVAAEVAVIGAALFDRLRALEARLEHESGSRRVPAPPPERTGRGPFAWLEPDRTAVFVPILLGAGVLLSAIAYLVERVARWTAPAAGEVPLAGLLRAPASPPFRLRRVVVAVVVTTALVAATSLGLVRLMATAKSRPDPVRPDHVTAVEVVLRTRGAAPPGVRPLQALAVTCRPRGADVEVEPAGDRWRVLVRPALGRTAERRFTGCLGDTVVDHVLVDVVEVVVRPVGAQAGTV